jgi:hypothetical protein
MARGMLQTLKENNIKPDSPILQEYLSNRRADLEKINPERAKQVLELQEELKRMILK